MRKLLLILNTLICFELIALPVVPGLSPLFISRAEAKRDCEKSGLIWDEGLRNCVVNVNSSKAINAAQNCGNDKECYLESGKNIFEADKNEGKVNDISKLSGGKKFLSEVTTAAAVTGALTIGLAGLKESKERTKCQSISFWTMVGGTAALMSGDIAANLGHNRRLKKIRDEWKDIVNPGDAAGGDKDKEKTGALEVQGQAFIKLAEIEDSMEKAAKLKETLYLVATTAFTVSATMATFEAISEMKSPQLKMQHFCKSSKQKKEEAARQAEFAKEEAREKQKQADQLAQSMKKTSNEISTKLQNDHKNSLQETLSKKKPVIKNLEFDATRLESAGGDNTPSTDKGKRFESVLEGVDLSFIPNNEFNNYSHLNQIEYNVESSTNFSSMMTNALAYKNEFQSPSIDDYYEIQKYLDSVDNFDRDSFEIVKGFMTKVLTNVSPLAIAHADDSLTSKTLDSYEDNLNNNGLGIGIGAIVGIGSVVTLKSKLGEGVAAKIITPVTRAAFSGVLAGLTFTMSRHAHSQAKASKNRASYLRKLHDDLRDATNQLNICKSEDRNNPAKPHCYCYTPDNAPNPSRGNSKVCQGLLAGNSNTSAQEYYFLPGGASHCVSSSYETDVSCDCKKTNTCMKLKLSGINALNPGTFTVMSNGVAPTNAIANGTFDPASVSPASLASNASKLEALNKKLEKHPAMTAYAKNKDKMQSDIMSSLSRGAASMPSGSMASSGMNSLPTNPAEAAKQLNEELKKPSYSGDEAAIGGVAGAAPTDAPDFGFNDSDLSSQEDQLAEVMNKDFEYGTNDINNGSSTNIFEVLSNRYQRSGLRRLFDEKGVTQPEAAAATDIAQ